MFTDANFDTQTRNLDGLGLLRAGSLVKKSNSEYHNWYVIDYGIVSATVSQGLTYSSVGFALLVLTREVMRDLGVG